MRVPLATALGVLVLATGCQTFTTAQSPFAAGHLNQGRYLVPNLEHERDTYATGSYIRSDSYSYFTFDLSSACRATGVILQVMRGAGNGGTWQLHDVTTPAATVNNPPPAGPGSLRNVIWEDLKGGVLFGEYDVSGEGSPDDVLSFALNSAGIAAFNAARESFFTLGGAPAPGPWDPGMGPTMFGGVTNPAKLIAVCEQRPS